MKKPSVVYLRRTRAPVEMPSESVLPVVEAAPRRGWRGLRGQVAGEFQSVGARTWRDDPMTEARGERRLADV